MDLVFDTIRNYSGPHAWSEIIIHHSETQDGNADDWSGIRAWHTGKSGSANPASADFNPYIAKPDKDIGYHFGIEKVNNVLLYQLGRPLSMTGAHCVGHNAVGIGICVVGNFDLVVPSDQHFFMLAALCRAIMSKFSIPITNIHGHREFSPKTCPGAKFNLDILKKYITGN